MVYLVAPVYIQHRLQVYSSPVRCPGPLPRLLRPPSEAPRLVRAIGRRTPLQALISHSCHLRSAHLPWPPAAAPTSTTPRSGKPRLPRLPNAHSSPVPAPNDREMILSHSFPVDSPSACRTSPRWPHAGGVAANALSCGALDPMRPKRWRNLSTALPPVGWNASDWHAGSWARPDSTAARSPRIRGVASTCPAPAWDAWREILHPGRRSASFHFTPGLACPGVPLCSAIVSWSWLGDSSQNMAQHCVNQALSTYCTYSNLPSEPCSTPLSCRGTHVPYGGGAMGPLNVRITEHLIIVKTLSDPKARRDAQQHNSTAATMTLLQRIKSVGTSRAKSEIYEISSKDEPLFVSQGKQPQLQIDPIQETSMENGRYDNTDKPLPIIPAPAIPARNPKRRERVQGPPSTGCSPSPSPPSTHVALDTSSSGNSRSHNTSHENLNRANNVTAVDTVSFGKSGHTSGLRLSLLSLNDILRDETIGEFDQLLYAIEQVQTSFADVQQNLGDVANLASNEVMINVAAGSKLDEPLEPGQSQLKDEDSAGSVNQVLGPSVGRIRSTTPEPAQADQDLSRTDPTDHGVKENLDRSLSPHDVKIDMSDKSRIDRQDPRTLVDRDHCLEQASEEVTVRLMLDTNLLQDREVIAALAASHSELKGGSQPTSAGNESGSDYSIDESHGSPGAVSDETYCRPNATGIDTPRTRYSDLIGDSPHAEEHDDEDEEECNNDFRHKLETPDLFTKVKALQSPESEALSSEPLELLSAAVYQPSHPSCSPGPAENEDYPKDEKEEDEAPNTRILSWLSMHPLPTTFAHPRPHTKSVVPLDTPSFGKRTSRNSSLRKSAEQERFALEAQLEIEDWLTEWTSSLQVVLGIWELGKLLKVNGGDLTGFTRQDGRGVLASQHGMNI
nr:hypothetical protein CFP56_24075 [Quercus suber]